MNPMIYFPLILLGVEKVLRGEKPYVLCLSVFAAAVSNFYFFYMIVLETIIYVLVRCCVLYGWRRKREFGAAVFKIGICSLIGVLLAAVILLPVILVYLNDYRAVKEYAINLFYELKYYVKIPAAFVSRVSMGYSAILGCGVPALMAVFLLFFGKDRKKYRPEVKALFIIGSLLLIFPAAAHVLNGFSYVSNRWVWGYSLLAAFILCDTWEELTAMQRRDAKRLLIFLAGYAGLLIVLAAGANKLWGTSMSGMLSALPYLGIACILPAGCLLRRNRIPVRAIKAVLFMLTFAGLIQNFHDMYGRGGNEESSYKTADQVNSFYNRKASRIVQKLQEQEKTFFRYTGNALDDNAAVNQGTHSMKYFWSLSNRNIAEFLIETQAYVLRLYHYKDLNERTILTTLAGNRYYLCNAKKEQVVPYGYQKICEEDGVCVYENMYALPLGYCYDSYVTETQAAGWNGAQKEEAMAQSVILEETPSAGEEEYRNGQPLLEGREIPLRAVQMSEGITENEQGFTVKSRGESITFEVEEACSEGESYLCMEGFEYRGQKKQINLLLDTVTASGQEVSRSMFYETKDSKWPSGVEDYTLNLGCVGEAASTITVTFLAPGTYQLDRLFLWNQPLTKYAEEMEALGRDRLVNEELEANRVSGDISLEKAKILCLTVPYDGGWTAYVDGEEQPLMKANYMFSALALPEGQHHIELRYCTPGLPAGLVLALLGAAALLGIACYNRYREKRR